MNGSIQHSCAAALGVFLFATPALADDTEQCLQLYYTKSYAKALPFCTVSAEKGNSQSQYVLGLMYSEGLGTKKNKPEAIQWLQAAAEQSYAAAHYKLNQLKNEPASHDDMMRRFMGKKTRTEFPAPFKRSGQASAVPTVLNRQKPEPTTPETPITHATNTAPDLKTTGNIAAATISPPDDQALYQQYLAAANKGKAHARFMLGLLYLEGRGVQKDPVQASKWIKMAANQGLTKAQLAMGLLYYRGYANTAPTQKKAMYWFAKAAEQGVPEAQYSLGLIYASNINGEKNDLEALKWWHKAATQGYAKAQHNLALMYLNGTGVKANRDTSIQWFIKEAEQGDPQIQFNLGRLYSEGKWFEQNGRDAANWFYRAGETWINMHQIAKARRSAEQIRQLVNQQHLTVPNLFLANVLTRKIEEAGVQ